MIQLLLTSAALALPAPSPVLDALVASNGGYGGGILRVAEPSTGQVLVDASGDAWRNGPTMNPSDAFEIASITKTFTAATVLLLAEDGTVDLDDPIGAHLPLVVGMGLLEIGGVDYGPDLTLRQLLQHTAGLPDYWYDPPYVLPGVNAFLLEFLVDPNRTWTPLELLDHAAQLDPVGMPGGGFHYSDTGYVMLGLMIEELEGQPLHDVYRSRITGPLQMHDTWLPYHEVQPAGQVLSHRYEGTADLHNVPRQSADWAGGGLVSTAADLEIFVAALATGGLFADPASWTEMTTAVPADEPDVYYGLGVYLVDLGPQGLWVGHEGYGEAWMWWWPQQHLAITGTLNQTTSYWWPLAFSIIDAVSP